MPPPTLRDVLHYLRKSCAAQGARDLTDGELLERFLTHREEAAFAVLVQRHGPMVLRVCLRVLGDAHAAEDCFQATFLVLVRRAASIRRKGSLGSWLYGVARRIAARAKAQAAARRHRERRSADMARTEPLADLMWRELRSVLDEEVGRLPEQCRAPVVLCYFEGKSYDEAARELGWPKSSLAGRLTRGRELLRQQLARRGLTLSTGALATALCEKAAAAPVTALLTLQTVKAAARVAVGEAAAAGLSAPAVALAEDAMKGALGMKGQLIAALLVLALAAGGAGLAARHGVAAKSPPVGAEAAQGPAAEGGTAKTPAPVPADRYGDPLPQGAVARLGTVRFRHGFLVNAVAFAPDGKVLASGGRLGFGVCLWDAATGRPRHRLSVPRSVSSLAFSPDGKLLFTGDSLSVIDVATGKEVRRLERPAGIEPDAVAFAPDGRTVAAGNFVRRGPSVILWDAATGKELRRLEGRGGVSSVAFAPGGKLLASGHADGTVCLWDVATGEEVRGLRGHDKAVSVVAFAPGGKVLASAGEDGEARLWEAATGKPLRRLKGHEGEVFSVAFSPDGKLLATAAIGGAVRCWEADTGKELRRWETPAPGAGPLAFAPDGKVLATGGTCIRLWDPATGQEIKAAAAHTGPLHSLQFAPDGKTLFSYGRDRKVLAWDPATGRERGELFRGPLGFAGMEAWSSVDLSPDGKVLAQVAYLMAENRWDPVIRLWDTVTGKRVGALHGHTERVRWLKFSPDGKLLASAGKDGIRLWAAATAKALGRLQGQQRHPEVSPVAFSPGSRWLAFAGDDQTLRLWDVAAAKEVRRWESRQDRVRLLVFSPDGGALASASDDAVRVWDTAAGKELGRFGGQGNLLALAFSRSGRVVIGAVLEGRRRDDGDTEDIGTIHLWEMSTGQEARRIDEPQGSVWSLALSPDGRTLASGGGDSTILLWDLAGRAGGGAKTAGLTLGQLEGLWSDLGGDAPQGHRAVWALTGAPEQSVPFLKTRLRPVAPADPERVARLVAELDSKRSAVREKAAGALAAMGEAAERALRRTLESNPTLEVRRRLTRLLERRGREAVRAVRAIEALEHIGSRESRRVLQAAAAGAANPQVVREARAALRRLAERRPAR